MYPFFSSVLGDFGLLAIAASWMKKFDGFYVSSANQYAAPRLEADPVFIGLGIPDLVEIEVAFGSR